ncbi:hypothetical protein EVAR_99958_1 [Eumeta japonica]|uniref:Uncharacterized protein n=1 Tax=Eumeta variegata TaxID=151549 RepID=A0A4C1ZKN0_EUMVA|nr:hypothetical protein EVAR_99958_1 [Eumeta japonica]
MGVPRMRQGWHLHTPPPSVYAPFTRSDLKNLDLPPPRPEAGSSFVRPRTRQGRRGPRVRPCGPAPWAWRYPALQRARALLLARRPPTVRLGLARSGRVSPIKCNGNVSTTIEINLAAFVSYNSWRRVDNHVSFPWPRCVPVFYAAIKTCCPIDKPAPGHTRPPFRPRPQVASPLAPFIDNRFFFLSDGDNVKRYRRYS